MRDHELINSFKEKFSFTLKKKKKNKKWWIVESLCSDDYYRKKICTSQSIKKTIEKAFTTDQRSCSVTVGDVCVGIRFSGRHSHKSWAEGIVDFREIKKVEDIYLECLSREQFEFVFIAPDYTEKPQVIKTASKTTLISGLYPSFLMHLLEK